MKRKLRALLPWILLAVYWPILFVSTHIPRPPNLKIYGSDVTLHFAAYLVLVLLYWLARYGKTRPSGRSVQFYLTIFIIACYGAIDEISQALVGRYCSFWDWLSDMGGCLAALGLLFILRRWIAWLIPYWIGFFVLTHWPQNESALIVLPEFLQPFRLALVMTAYLILTFLWWRTISPAPHFIINNTVFSLTIAVMPAYALLDRIVAMLTGRTFDIESFCVALAGIALGVACSAAFAYHHLTLTPHQKKP